MIKSILEKYYKAMQARLAKDPGLTESVTEFDDVNHDRF